MNTTTVHDSSENQSRRFKRRWPVLLLSVALPLLALDIQQPSYAATLAITTLAGDPEDDWDEEFEEELEDGIEQELEDGIEEELEDGVEQDLEEGVEDELEEGLENEMDENVEDEMDDGFEDAMVESGTEDFIEAELEQRLTDGFDPEIDEGVEMEYEQAMEEELNETIEDDFEFEVIDEQDMTDEMLDEYYDEMDGAFEYEQDFDFEYENLVEQATEMVDDDYAVAESKVEQEIWTENWLIFSDPDIQKALESRGYRFVSSRRLAALGKTLSTVVAPASFSLQKDYKLVLRQLKKTTMYADLNHVYRHQGAPRPPKKPGRVPADLLTLGRSLENIEIGMIDTAINAEHDAFKNANIKQKSFVAANKQEPRAHGTSIAGILVGDNAQYSGLVPKAKLWGASVFFRQKDKGNIATTESLLMALNWLAENKVKVINMSLSGPPNRLLEFAVKELCRQNVAIVAAVGNTGPLSAPLYPAGYDCTIAVTAVDDKQRIFKNAVIGPHVDLAAFGVELKTLTAKRGYTTASGTSLATAFVSAYLATKTEALAPAKDPLETWLSKIYKACLDLGVKGRDPIYGHGLLPKS